MIISYNRKTKGISKSGAVEYITRENKNQDNIKVLRGNPETTKKIINSISNKLKYRSGIISFEEKNPSAEAIKETLELFEKSTFAGLEKHQYDFLAVEHTDTDKYHIHFVIPRIELSTGKAFNPYWHKADETRNLKVQEYLNTKHNLTSSFQSEKRKTILNIDTKSKQNEMKQQIHEIIEDEIINQRIKNRDDIIQFFKDNDIKINREKDKYISIEIDNTKIRLEGLYYEKTFTNLDAITEETRRKERLQRVDKSRLEDTFAEIEKLISRKAEYNQKKYATSRTKKKEKAEDNIYNNSHIMAIVNTDNKHNSIEINKDIEAKRRDTVSKIKLESENKNDRITAIIERRKRSFRDRIEQQRKSIHSNFKRERKSIYDSFRKQRESIYSRTKNSNSKLRNTSERVNTTHREHFKRECFLRREWNELSRAITTITKASVRNQSELERIEREQQELANNFKRINEQIERIRIEKKLYSNKLIYQEKIFLETYNNIPTSIDLSSFYINNKKPKFISLDSKKDDIHIKDFGNKITGKQSSNIKKQAQLMLDICESKGWDLENLVLKGSEEFKNEMQSQIKERLANRIDIFEEIKYINADEIADNFSLRDLEQSANNLLKEFENKKEKEEKEQMQREQERQQQSRSYSRSQSL